MGLDLSRYESIDWDDENDPNGNLAHCRRADHLGARPERVVVEVLSEEPVEVKMKIQTAEFSIVGPDHARAMWWVVLFDTSHKRGDWLRPVTGWRAEAAERTAWNKSRRGGGVNPWLGGN